MPSRTVTIRQLSVLSYEYPLVRIRCEVSSGTYIRTLAADIGAALGTGAYTTQLRRVQVGEWYVRDAVTLDEPNVSAHLRTL